MIFKKKLKVYFDLTLVRIKPTGFLGAFNLKSEKEKI
jgi:hypothetical protein